MGASPCVTDGLSTKVASEDVDSGDGECTEEFPDVEGIDVVTSALGGVHRKAGWGAGGLIEETDFLDPGGLEAWTTVASSW